MTNPYTIEYSLSVSSPTWVDFSDNYIGGSLIPIIQRNSDYSISTKGFEMIVSDIDLSVNFSSAKLIRVLMNGTNILFVGHIVKSFKSKKAFFKNVKLSSLNNVYHVKVDYSLSALASLKIDYDTLNTDIIAHDDYALGTITLLGAMDVIFKVAFDNDDWGLTYSSILNDVVAYDKTLYQYGVSTTQHVKMGELRIDPKILYCINQDYAVKHTVLDENQIDNYDSSEKKINGLEFISFIAQALSLRFKLNYSDDGGWEVYRDNSAGNNDKESYSPIDGNVVTYEEDYIFGNSDYKWFFEILSGIAPYSAYSAEPLRYYYDTTPHAIESQYVYNSSGETDAKTHNLGWYKNLLILIQRNGEPDGDFYKDRNNMIKNVLLPYFDRNNYGCEVCEKIVIDITTDRNEITRDVIYDPSYMNFKNVLRNEINIANLTFRMREIA